MKLGLARGLLSGRGMHGTTSWRLLSACAVCFALGCADADDSTPPEDGGTTSSDADGESSSADTGAQTSEGQDATGAATETGDAGTQDTGADAESTGESDPWKGLEGDAERGAEIFEMSCGQGDCHGAGGLGPSLAVWIPDSTDDRIASVVLNGIPGGCNSGFCPGMPAQDLQPQEFADVLAYVREAFPGE